MHGAEEKHGSKDPPLQGMRAVQGRGMGCALRVETAGIQFPEIEPQDETLDP
jgi:hypothetical protein